MNLPSANCWPWIGPLEIACIAHPGKSGSHERAASKTSFSSRVKAGLSRMTPRSSRRHSVRRSWLSRIRNRPGQELLLVSWPLRSCCWCDAGSTSHCPAIHPRCCVKSVIGSGIDAISERQQETELLHHMTAIKQSRHCFAKRTINLERVSKASVCAGMTQLCASSCANRMIK